MDWMDSEPRNAACALDALREQRERDRRDRHASRSSHARREPETARFVADPMHAHAGPSGASGPSLQATAKRCTASGGCGGTIRIRRSNEGGTHACRPRGEATHGTRTRDLSFTKAPLYQLS